MPRGRPLPRLWGWVLGALWLLTGPAAHAALVLDDSASRIEAWPAVTVLSDPGKQLDLDEVRAATARFAAPRSAYATLGLRKDAVWLRLPVSVAAQSDGRWILDIDYAVLNRVDLHVVRDGQLVQHAVLGNLQPFSQRPMRSRSHAVAQCVHGCDVRLRLQQSQPMVGDDQRYALVALHQGL